MDKPRTFHRTALFGMKIRYRRSCKHYLDVILRCCLCLLLPVTASAAPMNPNDTQLLRQQEKIEATRHINEASTDVHANPRQTTANGYLPRTETPCFPIQHIKLQTVSPEKSRQTSNFAWAIAAANQTSEGQSDPVVGHCMGVQGINLVINRVQNAILKAGFVTTRVLVSEQDISTGQLVLVVVLGRVKAIHFDETSRKPSPALWNALPTHEGEILNLRDIEQGLENFKRLPSVETDINISPSKNSQAQPGDSDLAISWKQKSPFRFLLSLDNTGSESTGKYQTGFTAAYDNVLSLNDIFYVTTTHDAGGGLAGDRGTQGYIAHYSVPIGYSLLSLTKTHNTYHQSVAGAFQGYVYSGTADNTEVQLSRTIHRDKDSKTRVSIAGWQRASQNFIDDTEIEVQRRKMAGWELGVHHSQRLNKAALDLDASYRQGTGIFGSLKAPEEAFNEGTSRPKIVKLTAELNTPFKTLGKSAHYQGKVRIQANQTPLIPQDRFSIGSAYSVRGFDGENILAAERGISIQNNILFDIPKTQSSAYLGIDYGRVDGSSSGQLIGKELSGAAIGVKGKYKRLDYDVFLATPLKKPAGFRTDNANLGFSLNLSF